MKFQNHYNTADFPRRYEELPSLFPSLTIPDQSMPVSEIMRRFASGLPISGQRVPSFSEEEIPDMDKLDLSEKFDLVEENRNKIIAMQKEMQEQEQRRQQQENQRLHQEIDFEEIIEKKDGDGGQGRSRTTTKKTTKKEDRSDDEKS